MADLHTSLTAVQVTFVQPPPNGSQAIPNQQLQNIQTVVSSLIDNPGSNPSATASSYPYGIQDVYSVNPNLTQFYPVNKPPSP
jgi:hypothetical protein